MPRKRYSDDQIAHALRAADQGLAFSDLTDWRFNPSWSGRSDSEGRVSAAPLVPGHEYKVRPAAAAGGDRYFVWRGQKALDLEKLHRKRASIRALEGPDK